MPLASAALAVLHPLPGWLTRRAPPPLPPPHAQPADAAADILVSSGLRDAGYDTVFVTCAGWERDPVTHKLRENKVVWPRGCEDSRTWTCAWTRWLAMAPPTPMFASATPSARSLSWCDRPARWGSRQTGVRWH